MTKHLPEDITTKCPVSLGEAYKLKSSTTELLGKSTLAVCGAVSEDAVKSEVVVAVVQEKATQSELEKIMSELYDLENYVGQEKPLKIELDLDLYQMETL